MRKGLWLVIAMMAVACAGPPEPTATPSAPATPSPAAVETPVATPTAAATPAEEAKLDPEVLRPVLKRRYDDLGYAYMTRDLDALMDITTQPAISEDKTLNREQLKAQFEEEIQFMNELEKEAETTVRFSLQNEILELTPKGDGKVAAHVRYTWRFRTPDGYFVHEEVAENTDVWVQDKGVWRITEDYGNKEISVKRTVDGKEVEL